jgi:hypothetical protein
MTNVRVSTVQKARYGVLFLPVLWLLFSLWVVISEASSDPSYAPVQKVSTSPSTFEFVNLTYPIFLTVWVFVKILLAVKEHNKISAELTSGFAFFLGLTIMAINNYFHFGQFLFYVGIALTDIAALIVIVRLFQGKAFIGTTLYHQDVQVRRV